jgi:hypothetical protein
MTNEQAMYYLGKKVTIGSITGQFEFGWDGLENVFQLIRNGEPVAGGPLDGLDPSMIFEHPQ